LTFLIELYKFHISQYSPIPTEEIKKGKDRQLFY